MDITGQRLAIQSGAGGSRCLVATERIRAGVLLARLGAQKQLAAPARHTIQVGITAHILPEPEFLRYTNHSCEPNLVFDTHAMEVRTLRAVERGSELRYFYPSTEWNMASPFRCDCGSHSCIREVTGASHLDDAVLRRYQLAPHIIGLLARRAPRVA
jgi:hypothetical protein